MPRPAKTLPLQLQQCAELAGVSLRRIQQMIAEGELPKDAGHGAGMDTVWFAKWLKDRHARDFGVTDDGKVYNFEAERARKMKHDADVAEMEAGVMRGELIRAEDVERAWAGIIASARTRILALPPELAMMTAAPDRRVEVQAIAQRIVDAALTELADGPQDADTDE